MVENPETHDHPSPEVVRIVVNIVNEAQSHACVEIPMGEGMHVVGGYVDVGHYLFGALLVKTMLGKKTTRGSV